MTTKKSISFNQLGLNEALLHTLSKIGYETPTPVQAKSIPLVLSGKDVIVKAQTGTGKTAAFALPILNDIDIKKAKPQALVLAPTRELAIQVAEAFKDFGKSIKGLNIATIYGGGEYFTQDKALKSGAHIVIGTTGRLMDHMRKGKLKIDAIKAIVLDEADEMLRMGFQEDVEWILSHTPSERQTTLFSATMPQAIKKIANKYLDNPTEIDIKVDSETETTIQQKYIVISTAKKLDPLKRLLEVLEYDGMIIFVRTKTLTLEVADGLKQIGLKAEALNGDIAQTQRKQIVANLKQGKTDIVVATDVAARGIDIPRVSCVINYDMPFDTETYIHRIGRTGRAGRKGEAILFIRPNEKRMLSNIERKTKDTIESMPLPKAKDINKKRCEVLVDSLSRIMASDVEAPLKKVLSTFQKESGVEWSEIAFALSRKLDGRHGFLLDERIDNVSHESNGSHSRKRERRQSDRRPFEGRRNERSFSDGASRKKRKQSKIQRTPFRLEVGENDGVKPRNIVGAIANEGGISSDTIGSIEIRKKYSVVELPVDLSQRALRKLKSANICGKALAISRM